MIRSFRHKGVGKFFATGSKAGMQLKHAAKLKGVSADMALRLSEAFRTEPDVWLSLQIQRDLWVAAQKKRPRVKPFPVRVAA